MNELVRMQYLDALGIDSFVPRLVLPAAKASMHCELPVASENDIDVQASGGLDVLPTAHSLESELSGAPVSAAKPVAAGAFVKSLLEPAKPSAAKRPARMEADSTRPVAIPATLKSLIEPQAPSEHKALRFQLNFWHQPHGLSVLDTREPRAALPTTALLHNIYSVFSPDTHLPQGDLIQWPLIESSIPNPGELQDARDLTQAFLASRCQAAAPKLLLVMGDTAMQMLHDGNKTPHHGALLNSSDLNCPAIYLPSLSQLLKEPVLKRLLWPAVSHFGI